jgi:hypothetical protein
MEHSLRTELEFFRTIEPKLIIDGHFGNFVVIHDHEILAIGKDVDEALNKLRDQHVTAPEPLLIRQVLGDRRKPVSMRSPRVGNQPG